MRYWNVFLVVSGAWLASGTDALAARVDDGVQEDAAPAKDARPKDAAGLFAALAKVQGLEASFVEEKHLSLLALPLKSEGKLYILRPAYLARVVAKPEPSTLTIGPRELRMEDRGGVEVVDLRQNDDVRLFVTSIMRVFLGDQKGLEQAYAIAYEPSATDERAWKLTLEPRGEKLKRMLVSLVLSGKGKGIERIEMTEPNGDRTVTRVVKADPKRRFTAEEKQRLFGIEAGEGAR